MPFGFGFGELVMIVIIAGATFGATKLPSIGDSIEPPRPRLVFVRRSRWTWRHTTTVVAVLLLAAATALPILARTALT